MSVDPTPHLIVPFAQCSGGDWLQAVAPLKLQNLAQLLHGMKLIDTDKGQIDSLSPAHERVLARALGLTACADGLIPLAAFAALEAHQPNASSNEGWAFMTPCHWAMGREHATLTDPASLELNEADSRTLLADMQPYFATEGITLHYQQPTRWLAQGEIFKNLPTASLDRVLGRNVDRWLPASKVIKLLQNEMQMLLYTHSVNDGRAAKDQRSVNSFWVSGSGALNGQVQAHLKTDLGKPLGQAMLANNWSAYAKAWLQLDACDIAQLLAQQKSSHTVRISLCGESNAMTFETAKHSVMTKIRHVLSPKPLINLLKQL